MDRNVSKSYGQVGILRFIFSILIVYYHLTPILFNTFPDVSLYNIFSRHNGAVGKILVICFFIISGFFFEISKNYKKYSFQEFFMQKLIRFWPVLAFSLIVNMHSSADIMNLFFINAGMGIIKNASSNPASWFTCNLFWLLLIYFLLSKQSVVSERRNAALFIISILGLSIISRQSTGSYWLPAFEQLPFLTNGLIYGVTGMSIGILLAQLKPFGKKQVSIFALLSQICIGIYFIYIVAFCEVKYETAYYILVFVIIFYLIICSSNFRFLSHPIFKMSGDVPIVYI